MSVPELIAVGTIAKSFGIRGEVVVRPMTPDVKRFKKLTHVLVGTAAGSAVDRAIEFAKIETRGVRIKLAGIDDRTSAEAFVGQILFVEEKDRIRTPKGTWFVHDVIGARVIDEQRGDIGFVSEILKLPAHDVYAVNGSGKEILIPAVKEFIVRVDVAKKTVTVRLIEGMLEE